VSLSFHSPHHETAAMASPTVSTRWPPAKDAYYRGIPSEGKVQFPVFRYLACKLHFAN